MFWSKLSLTVKFNLIISILLFALFLSAAFYNYQRQQAMIVRGAIDNARLVAQQIVQTRDYMSSVIKKEPSQNYSLVPQVVATQVAKRITLKSPYYVRQVSLRYRNPQNRPDKYETEHLKRFAANRATSTRDEWEVVTTGKIEELRYMLPMVAEKSCLQCHGSYESAPSFVQKRFPKGHYSYNYQLGEVIGAVSVSIPMDRLYRDIGFNLKVDLLYRALMFFILLLILAILIHRIILHPISRLAEVFTEVTKTGAFSVRVSRKTEDEIGKLISAFNDMMEELERKTMQQSEAEERYRSFIEIAQSPVVTFLADGKIVITNQRADVLLGGTRMELIGEDFFSFVMDSEKLKRGITQYIAEGSGGGIGETARYQIRSKDGKVIEVDLALSASKADHNAMFTVILRPVK